MKSAEHGNAKKLIFDALHLDSSLPEADSVAKMQPEDWDFLCDMEKLHRLGPMLHRRLSGFAVPDAVSGQLKASQRRHAMRNLKIYRELVSVTRILNDANIPSIALKGAYLARFAYPDPGLRPMRDLDLLIRPEQVIDAFELLKVNGYQHAYDNGLLETHFTHSEHLPSLLSPDGIAIELHHSLISDVNFGYLSGSEDAFWSRSFLKSIGSAQIRFLAPEDLLLHLCVHATQRHQFNLGPLALTDIVFLLETHRIDWQAFYRTLSYGNWQRFALSLLHLSKLKVGADIPDEVIVALGKCDSDVAWQKSAEYMLFTELDDHRLMTENVGNFIYSNNLSEKISAFSEMLFPPRSIIARDFPVSASSPKVFLYYPMRWHRLISQKLPPLMRALAGQRKSLRQLAMHRKVLDEWLHQDTGNAK